MKNTLEIAIVKPCQKPKYSFIIPYSREWLFERWKKFFWTLEIPETQTELIIHLDSNSRSFRDKFVEFLKQVRIERPYNGIRLYFTNQLPLDDNGSVEARRQRIVELKEESKEFFANTKFVFCLEDDTFCPPNSFEVLLNQFTPKVGFVEAVEAGRWGLKMVGVWDIVEDSEGPLVVKTLLPREGEIEDISAGGFYCYITPTKLYKEANYRFEDECLGPDVMYSLDIKRKGFYNLVVWDLNCKHITPKEDIEVNNIVELEWHRFPWEDSKGKRGNMMLLKRR